MCLVAVMKMVMMMVMVMVMVMVMIDTTQAQGGKACQTSEGQSCVPISNCPPLLKFFNNIQDGSGQPAPGTFQQLWSNICDSNTNPPLVCCANSEIQPPQPTQPAGDGELFHPLCGVSVRTDHIMEGDDAPILAWPWMALLRGQGQWTCGGVLINYRYVLTAAQCVKEASVLEYVRIGEHTLSKDRDCQRGVCSPPPQDIQVEEIIRHPMYGTPCINCNDIALIRLATPAKLHPFHVHPICLPIDPVIEMGFSEQEFQGKYAWAAGWGRKSYDPSDGIPQLLDKLQQVLLPIQELAYCQRLRRDFPDNSMTLCAGGEGGKDTCRGDSGGPLVLSDKWDSKKFVVGIISSGPTRCGANGTQGLYTNVHYYVPWISSVMRP